MVETVRSIVGEYIRHVRDSGRNARLYLAGIFLIGLGQSVFSLLFNLYLRELGVSDSRIGQILSKVSLGAAAAAIPVALILRRVPAKRVLVPAGVLTALAYVLQATLTAPEFLLTVAFVAGCVITVFRLSIAPVIMLESSPATRPYLFSASFTVLFFSAIVGSALGGLLPHLFHLVTDSSRLALRWSLFAACALYLVSVWPFHLMKATPPAGSEAEEGDATETAPGGRADRPLGALRELADVDWGIHLKLILPAMMIGLGAGLIIPFMNLYFRDRFGLSAASIGLLYAVMQGFMVVGNLFGPAVSRRLGLVGGVVATQLASVPFMLVLGLSSWLPIVVASFFLRSTLMNMNQPLSSHFAMEVVRERDHAVTNSLLSLSWFVAWAISADIGGAMIERDGYTVPLLIAAALYVAASVLYWYFFRGIEERRLPPAEVELPEA
ncbi:MAG TPA: MFS transporter [Candidatus Eisenbacteria bacterium]|nr:MFS transporter [Candidatus Eisenbacteria bacterium]